MNLPLTKKEIDAEKMLYLQHYSLSQNLKNLGIKNFEINYDLSVDVIGSVNLKNKNLTEIPFNFNSVSGNFIVSGNSLTSLKGAPKRVGNDFVCGHNFLTSLEYCPKRIFGNFDASSNDLTTLEHGPEHVEDSFCVARNRLRNLRHAPLIIKGDMDFSSNPIEQLLCETDFSLCTSIFAPKSLLQKVPNASNTWPASDNMLYLLEEINAIVEKEKCEALLGANNNNANSTRILKI